jgi:hypothetical protein
MFMTATYPRFMFPVIVLDQCVINERSLKLKIARPELERHCPTQIGLCDLSASLLKLIPIKADTIELDLAISGKRGRIARRLTNSPNL